MGLFRGILSRVRATFTPAATEVGRAAAPPRSPVAQKACELDAAAAKLKRRRGDPVPVPAALRSGLDRLKRLVSSRTPGSKKSGTTGTQPRTATKDLGAQEIRGGVPEQQQKLDQVPVP